jgi:hypothetical protein
MPGIEPRAGTHRDEQRILVIAERAAGQLADMGERGIDLARKLIRILFAVGIEVSADFGRDREAGRHRQTEIGHLGEVGALAAEKIAHLACALGRAAPEPVDPLCHIRLFH